MQESEYLVTHYKTGSLHSRLFQDFTGKSIAALEKEGLFYIGLGFSYQSRGL